MEKSLKNKEMKQPMEVTDYTSAIKEFAKFTIHHPDFFKWSPEQQKKEAMKMLEKHKKWVEE